MFSITSFFTDLDTDSRFYKLLFYFPLLLDAHTQMYFKQLAMNYLCYSDLYVSEIISTIFTALKSFNSIQQNISLLGNNSQTEIDYIFPSLRKKKVNIDLKNSYTAFFLAYSIKEKKCVYALVLREFVNNMTDTD